MAELKNAWIKSAKSLVLATNDFICAVAVSAKAGKDKVLEWAESRNEDVNADTVNAEAVDVEDAVDEETVKADTVDVEATEIPTEEPEKESAE